MTRQARCPACAHVRDADAQHGLRDAETRWIAHTRASGATYISESDAPMRTLAAQNHPQWFWACDRCLANNRALPADPTRQTLGLGTPFAAYVDRPFRCEDCSTAAVFSAAVQKHWFETLQFLVWVHPKQCAPCRAERRRRAARNDELAAALHGLDATDPQQLEAVARLYDELGRTAKATEFRARARNRRRARES